MNTYTDADLAKEARRLQHGGMTAATAAEYLGTTVDRLDAIGGVMACMSCGETTADDHLFNGICLRVHADQVPTPISKWDDR